MCKEKENQKVTVCIINDDNLTKPSRCLIKQMRQRLPDSVVRLTAKELASSLISKTPLLWLPAELHHSDHGDLWVSQQVLAVHFYKSLRLEEVMSRLQEYGINCNFIFSTSSHSTTSPEFWAVFVLKEPITNLEHRDEILSALSMLFPDVCKEWKDPMHLLEGGKEILYADYNDPLHPLDLIYAGELHFLQGASKKTISRNLKKWGKNCNSIINILNLQKNHHFEEIRYFDYSLAAKEVKIFDDFINGNNLNVKTIFGIATNLHYITGGLKFMKDTLDHFSLYSPLRETILQYVRNRGYMPLPLDYFSPYREDRIHKNILTAEKPSRGSVRRTTPYFTISLEEGESMLEAVMKQVKESDDTKIHIVCAPTGLGKTKLIEDWERVLIAFPDLTLKEEVVGRMKSDYVFTPNPQDYLLECDKPLIDHFYRVGAVRYASEYINTRRVVPKGYSLDNPEWVYADYRKDVAKSAVGDRTVLTTHAKVPYLNIRHNTIVFDEDPLSSAFLTSKVSYLTDLLRIGIALKDGFDKRAISDLCAFIKSSHEGEVITLPQFPFRDNSAIEQAAVNDAEIKGNILDFITCPYFLKDPDDTDKMYFIKRYMPPDDRKVIILSAIADEWTYRQLFGERLEFHTVGQVEFKGKLTQDTSYTFSRENMTKEVVLEYAKQRAKGRKVITFMNHRDAFEDAYKDLYFDFCQGRDTYNDKLMAIIGTPHLKPISYKLYARELGLDIKPEDFDPKWQLVHRNGLYFWFFTYRNEMLCNIHLSAIERELRQAIGRARLIRRPDADVLVLSNYPLPEAKQLNEI